MCRFNTSGSLVIGQPVRLSSQEGHVGVRIVWSVSPARIETHPIRYTPSSLPYLTPDWAKAGHMYLPVWAGGGEYV